MVPQLAADQAAWQQLQLDMVRLPWKQDRLPVVPGEKPSTACEGGKHERLRWREGSCNLGSSSFRTGG